MKLIKELLYLQKSDRKVILTLLAVIVVALGIIFLTGGENETTNGLVSADSVNMGYSSRDSGKVRHRRDVPRSRERTVYVRTKVIYRDTAYQRGKRLAEAEYDSIKAHYQPKIRQGEHVVLNTADTTQLKMVPGIGPYFARKIIQYGQRLGGYVSVDQLDEIEDFPLDAKEYLTIETPSPVKLDINHLSLNELKKHPYINFYQARAITDYRRLHGPIRSLEELRLSKDFPPEAIERLLPYVAY